MRQQRWTYAVAAVFILLGLATGRTRANAGEDAARTRKYDDVYRVGLAQIDITPDYGVMLRGFAGRKTPATEVIQRIYAKALAISRPGQPAAVLIAVDICVLHEAFVKEVAQRLQKRVDLSREQARFILHGNRRDKWKIHIFDFHATARGGIRIDFEFDTDFLRRSRSIHIL